MAIEEIRYKIPLPFGRGLGQEVLRVVPPMSPTERPASQVVLKLAKKENGEEYGMVAFVEDQDTIKVGSFSGCYCSDTIVYRGSQINQLPCTRGKLRWRG